MSETMPWYAWLLLPVLLVVIAWEWFIDQVLCRPRVNAHYPIERW